jgi:hypothetical protein
MFGCFKRLGNIQMQNAEIIQLLKEIKANTAPPLTRAEKKRMKQERELMMQQQNNFMVNKGFIPFKTF